MKNRLVRRVFLTLSVTLLAAGLIAGCAKSSDKDNGAVDSKTEETVEEESKEQETESGEETEDKDKGEESGESEDQEDEKSDNEIVDGTYALSKCKKFKLDDNKVKLTGKISIWDEREYDLKSKEFPLTDDFRIVAYDNPGDENAEPSEVTMEEFLKYAKEYAKYEMLNIGFKGDKVCLIEIMS